MWSLCVVRVRPKRNRKSGLTKSLPKNNVIRGLVSDMTLRHTEDGPVEMFFGDIHFDHNSAAINGASVAKLMASAQTFSDPQLIRVEVVGHTDARGGKAYKKNLAQRRADAVKRTLVEKFGVPEAKIMVEADGAFDLDDARNPLAAENRRVRLTATISAR